MTFEEFSQLVRARRTQLVMDQERGVDIALINQLCTEASYAPNHQQTWPWLFGVFTGEARHGLGNVTADAMQRNGDTEMKVTKTRTKYMRSPVLLVVGTAPGETELQQEENRDAVAAGVQTLLLGATAMGLGSFGPVARRAQTTMWQSTAAGRKARTSPQWCIWVGQRARCPIASARRPPSPTFLNENYLRL